MTTTQEMCYEFFANGKESIYAFGTESESMAYLNFLNKTIESRTVGPSCNLFDLCVVEVNDRAMQESVDLADELRNLEPCFVCKLNQFLDN